MIQAEFWTVSLFITITWKGVFLLSTLHVLVSLDLKLYLPTMSFDLLFCLKNES